MRWTGYDARTAIRAAGGVALLAAIAWALTAATDEGGVGWAERLGRVLPLVPACGGLAAWLALVPARARGELRALAALGRSPARSALPAGLGAATVAVGCALVVAVVPRVDVRGFFPKAPGVSAYIWTGEGFVDTASHRRVAPSGAMIDLPRGDPRPRDAAASSHADGGGPRPSQARLAAASALLVAGLAFSLLGARLGACEPRLVHETVSALVAVAVTLAASTVLFAAAGAGRLSPFWVACPSMALLVSTAFRYRAESWRATAG